MKKSVVRQNHDADKSLILGQTMRGYRKFRQDDLGTQFYLSTYQRISKRAVRTSLEKQLDPYFPREAIGPKGPIASRGFPYRNF